LRIFALAVIFSGCLHCLPAVSGGPQAYALTEDFSQLGSTHFVIRYQKGVDKSYLYQIKDTAEKFYNVITSEFHLVRDKVWLWENRAEIIVARDQENYVRLFPCSEWSGACVDYQAKKIYTFPNQEKFYSILAHELTHIIFREYTRGGIFPLWLDEGIATYMEDKHTKSVYRQGLAFLKQRIKQNAYIRFSQLDGVTVGDLRGKGPDYVNLFYLQSFSIVYFIVKRYGSDTLYRFLYYLRHGSSLQKALSRIVYDFKTLEDLEQAWKRFYQE
jgi:hypothetical protein